MNAPVYLSVEQNPDAANVLTAARVLIEKASKYQVVLSESDARLVSEYRAHARDTARKLDSERLEMTRGLRETMAKINDRFAEPIKRLNDAVGVCDKALRDYLAEQQRKAAEAEAARRAAEKAAAEAQAAAQAAIEADDVEALVAADDAQKAAQAIVLSNKMVEVPTKKIEGAYGSTVSTRTVRKWRLVDISLVPETFLVPPEERLNRGMLTAAARGSQPVPGIEFYEEASIVSKVGS